MARRGIRSISVPITFGAVTVPLSAFLLVSWTTFTARNIAESGEVAENVWLMVLGVISFIVIMSVLVMFSIFLAREILEVRRQDGFIDSVTHELKTPLASIKLCLQTLEREGIPTDKRAALQKMMHDDVDRLATFIDDVLQASRLSHDDVGMDVDEVRLAELARHCAEVVSTRHKVPDGGIVVKIDPALVVFTDHAALEIVIRNLIDNAVKYSPATEAVEVSGSRRDGRVLVEVRDRGPGVASDAHTLIFEKFGRAAAGENGKPGSGLGLFIARSITEAHGGRLEVHSTPPRGTTFTLELPLTTG